MRNELLLNPDLRERLSRVKTLAFDIDQCVFPGPDQLNALINELVRKYAIFACTARSLGEMEEENYPGKDTFLQSQMGIFEAGMLVRCGGNEMVMCDERELTSLALIKNILQKAFIPIGNRIPGNMYSLTDNSMDPEAYGYFPYSNRQGMVPFRFSGYEKQQSCVIWPSGTFDTCPQNLDYFGCLNFINEVSEEFPYLFQNMDIAQTNGSVLIRPKGLSGESVTKSTGFQALQSLGNLSLRETLFLGDDSQMDFQAAKYIQTMGGIAIAPQNASFEMKTQSDIVLPGYAGEALVPFLKMLNKL